MKKDLVITQGSSFEQPVFWEEDPLTYKAITGITRTGAVRLTVPLHEATNGARGAIVGVKGSTELNAKHTPFWSSDFYKMRVLDLNTIELNEIPGDSISAYRSDGYLVYPSLKDLAGYSGRMTIRRYVGGEALLALTSPSGVVVDTISKTVTITITAAQTAALTPGRGVYDLEMESITGVVTKLLSGNVLIYSEVTT